MLSMVSSVFSDVLGDAFNGTCIVSGGDRLLSRVKMKKMTIRALFVGATE